MEAIGLLLILGVIAWIISGKHSTAAGNDAARRASEVHLKCPHCESLGTVRTERAKVKRGLSGGKVTGAVLTGGLSMLATGLARKEEVTEAYCEHCRMTWHIE